MCLYRDILHLITADSDTNAGGVGGYVSKNFSATILGKNLLQSNCEDLWLQIAEKSSGEIFNFGIIYRHPEAAFTRATFLRAIL